jgi:hypothetical protein
MEVQELLDRELPSHERGLREARPLLRTGTGSFLNLQNGFYNGLCQGLGLSPAAFQILQPSPPLLKDSDVNLWNYFNNIPPFSLTQNYISSGGNRYFDNYKGLIGALKATRDIDLKGDIGSDVYNAWLAYVSRIAPLPAPNTLPQMFLNWASIFYPDVAQIGAADLSAMLLDPITSAGMALMPYISPANPRPADWNPDYSSLVQMLLNAPRRAFTFDSRTMNSDVSTSWSQGRDEFFFGLWGNSSSSTSSLSSKFASSHITINASFDHVLTAAGAPSSWYNSAAMGDAFNHQDGPPWNPQSTIKWQNTFDPQNGNLARFMVNLIVVSGMHVRVEADAEYSSEEQQTVHEHSSVGIWPFYSSSSSDSNTDVRFDEQGRMSVLIDTIGEVPTVIGGNVLPVDKYLGHATRALRMVQSR